MIFWRRKIGTNTFRLWTEDNQSGYLIKNSWTGNAVGEWDQKRYYFLKKGFLKVEYAVFIDERPENTVATIKFSGFKTKAEIKVVDREIYTWQSDDFLGLLNSIWKSDKRIFIYRRKLGHGEVEIFENPKNEGALLLLSGLISQNYFSKGFLIIALIIVLILIW